MTKSNTDLKALFLKAQAELEEDEAAQNDQQAKKLHEIAKRLLLLERDLQAPGAPKSIDDRVERLLKQIENEDV